MYPFFSAAGNKWSFCRGSNYKCSCSLDHDRDCCSCLPACLSSDFSVVNRLKNLSPPKSSLFCQNHKTETWQGMQSRIWWSFMSELESRREEPFARRSFDSHPRDGKKRFQKEKLFQRKEEGIKKERNERGSSFWSIIQDIRQTDWLHFWHSFLISFHYRL